jgi:hypothetical protein
MLLAGIQLFRHLTHYFAPAKSMDPRQEHSGMTARQERSGMTAQGHSVWGLRWSVGLVRCSCALKGQSTLAWGNAPGSVTTEI